MAERYIPTDEQRHERTLIVCKLLKVLRKHRLTAEQMTAYTNGSTRTSYRFLRTLHDAGYVIMKEGKRFYIAADEHEKAA
jgi:predicted DNA-binding transcriptional regulator YafY